MVQPSALDGPSDDSLRHLLRFAEHLARRLVSPNEASDIAGEAAVALAKLVSSGRWNTINNHHAWVRVVVVRKAATFHERRIRRIEAYSNINSLRPTGSLVPPDPAEVFDSTIDDLFRELTWAETRVVVLWEKWRSADEVGIALGITPATVYSHLSRARAKLKRAREREP